MHEEVAESDWFIRLLLPSRLSDRVSATVLGSILPSLLFARISTGPIVVGEAVYRLVHQDGCE